MTAEKLIEMTRENFPNMAKRGFIAIGNLAREGHSDGSIPEIRKEIFLQYLEFRPRKIIFPRLATHLKADCSKDKSNKNNYAVFIKVGNEEHLAKLCPPKIFSKKLSEFLKEAGLRSKCVMALNKIGTIEGLLKVNLKEIGAKKGIGGVSLGKIAHHLKKNGFTVQKDGRISYSFN
jgi:hypothetical protein